MYCEKCGAKIADDCMFCEQCGAQVTPLAGSGIKSNYRQNFSQPVKKAKKKFKKLYAILAALGGAALIAVGVIICVACYNNSPKTNSTLSNRSSVTETATDSVSLFNQSSVTETATNGVSFDLEQYESHGELSCGLIYCVQYNWDDSLDQDVEEFAYFDFEGNRVSDWFDYEELCPSDFVNNYVMISDREKSGKNRKYLKTNYIYDTEFNEIAAIKTDFSHTLYNISLFNDSGYALAYGINSNSADTNAYSYWIDKDGVHQFPDEIDSCSILSDVFDEGVSKAFVVTDKYFILADECITDKKGNVIVNLYDIAKNDETFSDNYSLFGSCDHTIGDGVQCYAGEFRNLEFLNDNAVYFEYCMENESSEVDVWFECTVDLDGNIINGPYKESDR